MAVLYKYFFLREFLYIKIKRRNDILIRKALEREFGPNGLKIDLVGYNFFFLLPGKKGDNIFQNLGNGPLPFSIYASTNIMHRKRYSAIFVHKYA